jgi:hypothetical protein
LFVRGTTLLVTVLLLAGCDCRSGSDRGREEAPPPSPSPSPAYLKMPLDVKFKDVPKVSDAIRNPSPPIKEAKPGPAPTKTP